VDRLVVEVVRSVELELQRQPAHMVYEMLDVSLSRRLPGTDVDQEMLKGAAARIAVGIPAL
jgi:hypothetical protein